MWLGEPDGASDDDGPDDGPDDGCGSEEGEDAGAEGVTVGGRTVDVVVADTVVRASACATLS